MGFETESAVRSGMKELLRTHDPDADVRGCDDTVVTYVAAIIEEVAGDGLEVDVAGVREVLIAYVPRFEAVSEPALLCWLIDLARDARMSVSAPVSTANPVSQSSLQKRKNTHRISGAVKTDPPLGRDVRNSIMNRYGYIDNADDGREQRPLAGKKMIRYRDGQVVSLKGERYSVLQDQDSEAVKKTYVHLKAARKYRFH
ncbi:CUE domain-containing protein 2-A-like [Oratosquilla oratoria]|uniref:CUE domain-containing protein 2-A-like n=1 Tax=Oratosquilla oratoria TaxID=337810 RepID=UPI003F76DAFC